MPTYEYECNQCGHRFEAFQSMKDEPLKECPECGGPVRRLIGTGAGFLFKGSGFYTTDYRSSSYKEKAKKEKAKNEGGSGESKTKPESAPKPEAKPKTGDAKGSGGSA